MKEKPRIPVDGGQALTQNPFEGLQLDGLPEAPASDTNEINQQTSKRRQPNKNRGRVDIIRQTAHRGGKTVTVVSGFVGISEAEKEQLAKQMQKHCGTGGTVKEGRIEIQGDRRPEIAQILTQAGFRPVFAGG